MSGFQATIELKVKELNVYEDSTLIIYQVKGEWKTRDLKLVPYQKYLTELTEKFDEITFFHLSRDKNQFMDGLEILASMTKMDCEVDVQPL